MAPEPRALPAPTETPAPLEPARALALGAYHSCVLVASGRVACFGDNSSVQLGASGLQLSSAPLLVAGLSDVVELHASYDATCARVARGDIANIAFHEIMHNKLDVGTRTLSDLHRQGGGGLARPPPTEQWTSLTRENVTIMARHLFLRVPQYTGVM